jgi:hypothetical protein
MAAEREALSESEFVAQMEAAGVRGDTADFIWTNAVHYYSEPLKPDPNDRWETTMRIDEEELEDIAGNFWHEQGWPEPSPKEPVALPSDPTLLEFALWLDEQRRLHG